MRNDALGVGVLDNEAAVRSVVFQGADALSHQLGGFLERVGKLHGLEPSQQFSDPLSLGATVRRRYGLRGDALR